MTGTGQRDRAARLDDLRALVARLERGGTAPQAGVVALCPAIDRHLPGGGLARAALHEVRSAGRGAAFGFCALLLARAGENVVWIGARPGIWPPGAAAFGLSADALVLAGAPRPADGLWAMEEALRSPAVAGAVLEVEAPPDLVALRRLQLAAEAGGGLGLLLLAEDGPQRPTTARTRWRVAAIPTTEVDRPCWSLTLLRGAGGRPGCWSVSWDRAAQRLDLLPAWDRVARSA